jgi:hypothetical protein
MDETLEGIDIDTNDVHDLNALSGIDVILFERVT